MDQYKISQNPDGPEDKPPEVHKASHSGRRYHQPRHRNVTLSPQLIIGAVVAAILLFAAGAAWAHWLSGSNKPATGSSGSSQSSASVRGTGVSTGVTAATFTAVTNAVANKDTSALSSHYAKQVHVRIVASSIDKTLNANEVNALINDPLSGALDPWNWHVSSQQISIWQAGPDGQYFTGNDLIGISSNGDVISIGFDDNGQIDSIFIAPVSDLTGSTGSSTDNSGSGTSGTGSGTTDNGGSGSTTSGNTPVNASD